MPKGKTNAPLNILVIGSELYDSEPMKTLHAQGHNVFLADAYGDFDRIYGHNCYRMTKDLLSFLPISLKEARLEKKARAVRGNKQ
ncbi:MAG: hypothetical protein KGI54_18765 [Pseudomonadota bacterium]|nr:hypothetical protein [Pseudomonadota bacterium]